MQLSRIGSLCKLIHKKSIQMNSDIEISGVYSTSTSGIYTLVTFTGYSTIKFKNTGLRSVLIVGGGGSAQQGGGGYSGSGGGGGGCVGVGNLNFVKNTIYTIRPGNGGSGFHNNVGMAGQRSTIVGGVINEIANGGTAGTYDSGGSSGTGTGSLSYSPSYSGGNNVSGTRNTPGSGGAGAGVKGNDNVLGNPNGADGGNGYLWNINNTYYGGGGGGGCGGGSSGGNGGMGGGGNGANLQISGTNTSIGCPGNSGTGGGGGGGLQAGAMGDAGEGGSGVVIIVFTTTPTIQYNNIFTFLPNSISNCLLWLDSDDSDKITTVSSTVNTYLGYVPGLYISQWNDKSGNNNHFTQNDYSYQPLLLHTKINGRNIITANGYYNNLKFLTNSNITLGTTYTIFTASFNGNFGGPLLYGKATSTNLYLFYGVNRNNYFTTYVGNGTTWNDTTGTTVQLSGSSFQLTGTNTDTGGVMYISGMTNNGTSNGLVPYYNGVAQPAKNGTTSSFTGLSILGNDVSGFNAFCGDILIYNTVLSTNARQKIEGYLSWKWGVQQNLPSNHPYRSVPPPM